MVLTRVSIVIPIYNAARTLRRCLDSVGAQTVRDFEVIAIDDGSADGSGKLLDAYEPSYPLVRLHQANAGVSAARNRALEKACGEYVMFLDADDVIHPRLLEDALAGLVGKSLDYLLLDYRKVPDGEVESLLAGWRVDPPAADAEALPVPAFDWFVSERRLPAPWQFVFRRATLERDPFSTGIAIYEDVPFVLGYLAAPHRGVHLRHGLYGYAIMAKSQSHNSPVLKRIAGIEAGMRLMRERLDARQYRIYAKTCCASWIMDLWREIHALPRGPEKMAFRRALGAFVRRALKERLVRWGDFRFGRRIRLFTAVLYGLRG